MSTRTVVAVVAVIAAVIIGGAIIWAVSDDDETRRQAALEPGRPAAGAHTVTMQEQNGGQPFAIGAYSVGAKRMRAELGAQSRVEYERLTFTKPLDALSVEFFRSAAQGQLPGPVELSVNGVSSTGKPEQLLRYVFGDAAFARSDETAPGDTPPSATQSVGIAYASLQLQVGQMMGYAPATNTVGWLEIPGVAAAPYKAVNPAYLLGYSWGWQAGPPNAETKEAGAFTIDAIRVARELDRHAPWFWQQLVSGSVTPDMKLVLERPSTTGKPAAYMTYRLSNVQVTSVQDSGNATPQQGVTLEFDQIELQPEGATGNPATYSVAQTKF